MQSMGEAPTPQDNSLAAEKVRSFPHKPGVYLMKDAAGRVIYVGKAKDLRSRAGSYFLKAAAEDPRTARLVQEIRDIDYLEAESEVDALLVEARLIKDIQPKFNQDLKDDKTFPYLEIHTGEDFPRVEFTREPSPRGTKLYGPFASAAGPARGDPGAAEDLQVPHLLAGHRGGRPAVAVVPAVPAGLDPAVYGPVQPADLEGGVPQGHPPAAEVPRRQQAGRSWRRCARRCSPRPQGLRYEEAARLRDEIQLLETLDQRGELDTHVQPEVFPVDPKKGLAGLKKVLHLDKPPRMIEGVDIAHLAGTETVASLVQFIDGLPFKPGYKRFRIRHVEGIDDMASIHEVVARRFQRLRDEGEVFPDILLIDGGKGQLNAALAAFSALEIEPPTVVSLAKRLEEVFVPGAEEPLRLARHSFALRLLQYVRDEAHRFAQHYHHILRRRSTLGE